MRRLLPLLLLAACQRDAAPADAPAARARAAQATAVPHDLVAVAEIPGALQVLRQQAGGAFVEQQRLPAAARSIRFSPDARTLAWVQDDTTGEQPQMLGFVQSAGDAQPRPLGPLGLRKVEGGGLAVGPGGRLAYVEADGSLVVRPAEKHLGRAAWPLFGDDGALAWVPGAGLDAGCVTTDRAGASGVCGRVRRPVASSAGALLYLAADGVRRAQGAASQVVLAGTDPLEADAAGDRVLEIDREVIDGGSKEVLLVAAPHAKVVLMATALVSARWDDDGTMLVVRRDGAVPAADRIVAHAPDEFGGEALGGEALRVPVDGPAVPLPGLEGMTVRALLRSR